jgi:uncharacterized protein YdhG (YjbR/CyaY superfamily)
MEKNNPAKDIDHYLVEVPQPARTSLEKVRHVILKTCPQAEEVISYGIPSFKYKGMLVGFAAFKEHCSFFVMNSTFISSMKEELKTYKTTKSAIHFPHNKVLPVTLMKKIIKMRMKENEELAAKKKKK